jgi:hypothetical protein
MSPMMRRERPFSESIRWWGRYGFLMPWGLAVLLAVAGWMELRQHEPLATVLTLMTPILVNIGCGFLLWYLRPRLLANANKWEQYERSGSFTEPPPSADHDLGTSPDDHQRR